MFSSTYIQGYVFDTGLKKCIFLLKRYQLIIASSVTVKKLKDLLHYKQRAFFKI